MITGARIFHRARAPSPDNKPTGCNPKRAGRGSMSIQASHKQPRKSRASSASRSIKVPGFCRYIGAANWEATVDRLKRRKALEDTILGSIHLTGTVNSPPVFKRTRNDRLWAELLVEECTLIPISCFRNAAEQAKNLEASEKVTVIVRLRRGKAEPGTRCLGHYIHITSPPRRTMHPADCPRSPGSLHARKHSPSTQGLSKIVLKEQAPLELPRTQINTSQFSS
jgi:hypothetical protein